MKRPVFKTKFQQYILSPEDRTALASRYVKFGGFYGGLFRKAEFSGL
jgi:hypothetical protein